MSIYTIEFEWYNPRNPKCRNCALWGGKGPKYQQPCTSTEFKGRKLRDHNSKACSHFASLGGMP